MELGEAESQAFMLVDKALMLSAQKSDHGPMPILIWPPAQATSDCNPQVESAAARNRILSIAVSRHRKCVVV